MSMGRAGHSRVVVGLGRWAVGALRTSSRIAAASVLVALDILFLNYVVLSTAKARVS